MVTRSTLDMALLSGWFGAGLPEAARAQLASLAELTSHPAGAVVIREGSMVDALGIVVDGRVAIRLDVPGRGVATIQTVEPGDCVGWSALVPPYRATATVVTLEPTTLLVLDGPALRAAVEADPALGTTIMRRVLEAVGRRLQATRTQLLDLFAQAEG